ncbi:hypothetical protein PISMIDRAFT_352924 [Pisolithus microcarpus 441]|uniref:Uncharacterized protein n=1 Tax=Pisolithus microcarpus 441 TaxID=765257 RepID=A0A0C9ZSA2_9AGAM|nr:hypothetical protein PISMIDRAFT_352924 [Pisolithus microcarpus 441]
MDAGGAEFTRWPSDATPEGSSGSANLGTFTPLCSIVGLRPCARRQQFKKIREHFYTVADLHHIAGTEASPECEDQWTTSGMIDISVMFSLDYLQELIGEITFFERLPSIMQAWRRGHDLSTYLLNPSVSSVTRSLPRCLNLLGTWTGSRYDTGTVYRVLPLPDFPGPLLVRKPTNRHEIEFISESLSARLLERICVTLNDAWGDDKSRREDQVDDTDFDVARVRSMIQEIEALQAQLEATDDDDEQRALEEDLTGQILWLYWCGIRSEVDHILALVSQRLYP